MKKVTPLLSILLLGSLCSCSMMNKHHELSEYQRSVSYREGFNVLQLTDIHLSVLSDLDVEFDYLKTVIYANAKLAGLDPLTASDTQLKEHAPDVIVITGDTFQTGNKIIVDSFFKWIDSLNIPFAFTYGNHDYHGLYGEYYVDSKVKECKNSLLVNFEDDVFGQANYVIDVKDGNAIKWQLYVVDSNDYRYLDYDIIHDDQVKWYEDQVKDAKARNGGATVPSMMFFHVPTEEFMEAWNLCTDNKQDLAMNGKVPTGEVEGSIFYMGDDCVSSGYRENDLFETAQRLGSTKAMMVGHDHTNNTDFHYNKDGNGMIRLIYGTKSGHGIYHDPRIMGGNFLYLAEDGNVDASEAFYLKRINVNYDYEVFEMNDQYMKDLEGVHISAV